MKNKIIFWGNVNSEEKVHLVSWDGETGSQYHRINGTLVEYAVVATYEQLKEELRTKKPVILCIECLKVLDWNKVKAKCQRFVYIPEMSQLDTDALIRTALFSTKCYLDGRNKMLLGGTESSADHIALQILKNFSFLEKSLKYSLYIGGTEALGVDEVSRIEDVMQDYSQEGSSFYIEQIMMKEKTDSLYYILNIEE